MQINPVSSQKFVSNLTAKASAFAVNAGEKISKALDKDSISKFINNIEPTGANNAFPIMTTLMIVNVIIPRIITAAKRNPDDKEATRDEIIEILFRDVQTVGIILFALKAVNSVFAHVATKKGGLPMLNRPYKPLFKSQEKGFKGFSEKTKEFMQQPGEKLKTILTNIKDTIHPTGGVMALTNDEYIAKYSNYNSIDEISKMLNEIEPNGGNKGKVFDKIVNILIDEQETFIKQEQKNILKSGESSSKKIKNANEILSYLKNMKEEGPNSISNLNNKKVENIIISFFENKDNKLVREAKGLNAKLRTGALAFESIYLGWGLPALNQIRLERKYLKNNNDISNGDKNSKDISQIALMDKNIKAREVKLYHNFIK